MSRLPKISIVTPSFNQAAFLEDAILSIRAQEYPDVEHIVIDGGSTDGSRAILEKQGDRLAFWCSEKDEGQYHAVNKGHAKSNGEIMGWLNSDDRYAPWALKVVGEIFATFPEVEWLTTLFPMRWDREGRAVRCSAREGYPRGGFLRGENLPVGDWFWRGWIQQESTFWRRSLWERAGGGLDTAWKLGGDFELWARFFQHAELFGISTPLGGFRLHGDQRSKNFFERYKQDALEILEQAGGSPRGKIASSLRYRALRCLPGWLAPAAERAGLLFRAKVINHKRAGDGWEIASVLC